MHGRDDDEDEEKKDLGKDLQESLFSDEDDEETADTQEAMGASSMSLDDPLMRHKLARWSGLAGIPGGPPAYKASL